MDYVNSKTDGTGGCFCGGGRRAAGVDGDGGGGASDIAGDRCVDGVCEVGEACRTDGAEGKKWMDTSFFAMIHRMRYINRWGLMRNTETENIQEHSHDVAVIAHALALVRLLYFSENRLCPSPHLVAVLALYHDVPEIVTGDMPKPLKYHSLPMETTYRDIEGEAAETLLSMLPDEMAAELRKNLMPDPADPMIREARALVKAADCFSAYIKCLDEKKVGNREFDRAMTEIGERLEAFDMPEVRWFRRYALPAYAKSLDDIDFDFSLSRA